MRRPFVEKSGASDQWALGSMPAENRGTNARMGAIKSHCFFSVEKPLRPRQIPDSAPLCRCVCGDWVTVGRPPKPVSV
jgi:hypothetical protein